MADYVPGTVIRYSVSAHIPTGTVVHAPAPEAFFVGESPDGAWWLYAQYDETSDGPGDAVLAFNPETGEIVTLIEKVELSPVDVDQYYVWSDYVE